MSIAKLRKDLASAIQRRKYIDVNFYDQPQWIARERVEPNAHLTMCAEGVLYELLNGYRKPGRYDLTLTNLNEIAAKYGYYVDQHFSWSWHFYPATNGGEGNAVSQ